MRSASKYFAVVTTVASLAATPATASVSTNCIVEQTAFASSYQAVQKFPKQEIEKITKWLREDVFRKILIRQFRQQKKTDGMTIRMMGIGWPKDDLKNMERGWVLDDVPATLKEMLKSGAAPHFAMPGGLAVPPTRWAVRNLVASIWDEYVSTGKAGESPVFHLPQESLHRFPKFKSAKTVLFDKDLFSKVWKQKEIAGVDGLAVRLMVMDAAIEYRALVSSHRINEQRMRSACDPTSGRRG